MGLTAKAIVQEVERLGDERDVCRDQVFKLGKQLAQAYTNADATRAMNLAYHDQLGADAAQLARAEAEVDRLRQVNVEYAQQVGQLTKRVENQSKIITDMRERSLGRLNEISALQKERADLNFRLMFSRGDSGPALRERKYLEGEVKRLEGVAARRLKLWEIANRELLRAEDDADEKEARIEQHLATIKCLQAKLNSHGCNEECN